MAKIVRKTDTSFIPQTPHCTGKRGAKVYGMPLSKELEDYIEDVSPNAQQQRLLNMFFAGKFSPVSIVQEDDFDLDGDF